MTSRREALGAAAFCLALALLSVLPLHRLPPGGAPGEAGPWLRLPASHDLAMHFDHMRAFWRGLGEGRPYPRWEEPTNRGFGAPSTAFHPPGLYYLTSALYALTRDWRATFLLTHLVLMGGSGVAIWAYARRHLSPRATALSATLYVLAPYHLLSLYQRAALAELLAMVWLPLVWLGLERVIEAGDPGERRRRAGCLALAFGALAWSHPPTALQFSLVTGVWLSVLLAGWRRSLPAGEVWRRAAAAVVALALGLGLSAAYLLPATIEQELVRSDVFRARWPYSGAHLFLPRPAETPPEFWALLNATWMVSALALVLCVVAWRTLARPPAEGTLGERRPEVAAWAAAGGFTLVLITPLAAPLTPLLPGLEMTSFPWRLLSVATLAIALLTGAAVEAGLRARVARRLAAAGLLLGAAGLAFFGSVVFSATRVVLPIHAWPAFHPRPERPTANKFWVLPRWAPEDPKALPETERATLIGRRGSVQVERWDAESRALHIRLAGADRLSLRTFDFPGWTARLDGRPAAIERGALGQIVLALPAGDHQLTLEFRNTPWRRLGAWISGACLALVVLAWLWGRGARIAPEARPRLT